MANVTVAPREHATPVEDPVIPEARSLRSGRILNAKRLISAFPYDAAIRLRECLKLAAFAGRPRLACPVCGVTLFLASSMHKNFYLRHRSEDGSCPAVTRTGLSEADIRAMKYRGAQESGAHIRIKELLVRSLEADPRFRDVVVEKTWHASEGTRGLRRPDVAARIDDLRLAFEVQLSTTFLDVVLGRKIFYKEQGAALVWILPGFDPNYRRMTTDDILFGNNSNVLVVDEATVAASVAADRFILRVWHRQPRIEGDRVVDDWIERLVGWDELKIDVDRQTICALDFEASEAACYADLRETRERQRIEAETAHREAIARIEEELRGEVFEWALTAPEKINPVEHESRWKALNYALVPFYYHLEDPLPHVLVPMRMVWVIETARTGVPVGFGYRNVLEVAHHLLHQHPELIIGFGYLLRAYGNFHLLEELDKTGKWKRKVRSYRTLMRTDPLFKLAEDEDRLFAFLSNDLCRKPPTEKAPD
ncbi:MAG: DUF6035 family protein [Sphingomonas sp.]|uniref:DUF6035 family protein n=1 Tax=Sphingomonas sp. TaxID=28214 RepID=UPI003F7FBAF2